MLWPLKPKKPYYIDHKLDDKLTLRMRMAMLAQSMYVLIWEQYKDSLTEEARRANEEQMYDDIMNQMDDDNEDDLFLAGGMDDMDNPEPETRLQNLQRRFPGYQWNSPQYKDCQGIPLKTEKYVKIPKDVVRDINWKAAQKHYKNLAWDMDENSPGVTFVELAIDFELMTGYRLTNQHQGVNTSLNEKARKMKTFYKHLCRKYPEYMGPAEIRKCKTITLFGGDWHPGLAWRPAFLGKIATDEAIAHNVTSHYEKKDTKHNSRTISSKPDYSGIRVTRHDLDTDITALYRQIEDMTPPPPPVEPDMGAQYGIAPILRGLPPEPQAGGLALRPIKRRLTMKQHPPEGYVRLLRREYHTN